MTYLRLIKYPGAKTVLIPDISRVFIKSGARRLVDVFGGSGTVSLNIRPKEIVFNDINWDIYNLFLAIKEDPSYFLTELSDLLNSARYNNLERGKNADSRNSGREKNAALQNKINSLLNLKSGNESTYESLSTPDLIYAFRTLCRFSVSFGGMGNTYGTETEKSLYTYMRKTLHDFKRMSITISTWEIENLDFRDLIKKYDSTTTFFYLDPPYPGKDWYDRAFGMDDYDDIQNLFESVKGKYLMNLDSKHKNLEEVFGKPSFVKRYFNMNGKQSPENHGKLRSFYTNVPLQQEGRK